MLRDKIIAIFVKVDDFCNKFEIEYSKQQLSAPSNVKTRNRKSGLCDSEIITLLIAFHDGQFRNFKHFYLHYVSEHLHDDFPGLVSYHRFIELGHRSAIAFMLFLHHCCKGECTGISFIDSTVLRVKESSVIKHLKDLQKLVNQLWAGSSDLNFI